MSIYVGIDVGKFFHVAYCLDERGNRPGYLKFDNDLTGFTELEKLIGKLSIPDNDNVLLGMEATGHYWFPLYEFLKDRKHQVKVFNPLKVNRFRDFYIQPMKTDPKDAFVIANILRYGKVKPTVLPPENIQKLKRIVRYRRFLTEQRLKIKNKIRCMLDEIFPEYQRVPFFPNLFGQTSRALLKIAPIPAKILTLPLESWAEYLVSHSKGRLGWERAWRKADLICQAARSSIGSKVVASALEECMRDLLYELEHLEDRIGFFTKEIEDRLSLTPGRILISIPGVGPVTAATIISEIGDISQFGSADTLVCYCGLIPSSHSSGTFTSKRNRMAKRGQSSLAHVFYQIALSSLRCNPTLREYYEEKLCQGKPRKIAVVAVARKLVRLAYGMLKNGQPYTDSQRAKVLVSSLTKEISL
jgi:transposase